MGKFIVLFVFLFSINLYAYGLDYSFFFSSRFQSIHNLDDLNKIGTAKERSIYRLLRIEYEEPPGIDGDYPVLYTGGGVNFDFLEQFTFNFVINTREISIKTIEEPYEGAQSYLVQRFKDNFFIDEANIEWYPSNWFYLKAGQMLMDVGRGDILNSYQTGAESQFNLMDATGIPLSIGIAFSPLDAASSIPPSSDSLLYKFDLGYRLDFVDEIKLSFLHLDSRDPWIIPAIYDSIEFLNYEIYLITGQQFTINASGHLNWTGVSWEKGWEKLSTAGAFFFEFGSARYSVQEINNNKLIVDSTGFLFDGELRYQFDSFNIYGFTFLSSGDLPVRESDTKIRYNSFISLLPLITRTNIFFNGGINSTYSSGTFYSSGVLGLGVIAPGMGFSANFTDEFKMDFVFALFWSYKKPESPTEVKPFGDFSNLKTTVYPERDYGKEIDLTFSYEFYESLTATLEMDFFLPGNFYPDNYNLYDRYGRFIGNYPIDWKPVTQIILGVDFSI